MRFSFPFSSIKELEISSHLRLYCAAPTGACLLFSQAVMCHKFTFLTFPAALDPPRSDFTAPLYSQYVCI